MGIPTTNFPNFIFFPWSSLYYLHRSFSCYPVSKVLTKDFIGYTSFRLISILKKYRDGKPELRAPSPRSLISQRKKVNMHNDSVLESWTSGSQSHGFSPGSVTPFRQLHRIIRLFWNLLEYPTLVSNSQKFCISSALWTKPARPVTVSRSFLFQSLPERRANTEASFHSLGVKIIDGYSIDIKFIRISYEAPTIPPAPSTGTRATFQCHI